MPYVKLSGDFAGHASGAIVELTNDEYGDAMKACVVAKTYPGPVPGVLARVEPVVDEPAPRLESFPRPEAD